MISIDARVKQLAEEIKKNINISQLSDNKVALLAASKGQDAPFIMEAIGAGIIHFGENRVQEAQAKWPALRQAHPQVKLHLIGPLQANKIKQALALFDVIQTIDRPALAEMIANEIRKNFIHPHIPTSPHPTFFIQVNTGKEPQKNGVMPEDAEALITYCRELGLPVTGLMCIPPHDQPPAPHFAFLRRLAKRHGLAELSMGMSDDFATAIRMGSTYVRVGRGIFGPRS